MSTTDTKTPTLKAFFDTGVIGAIGSAVARVHPAFDLDGYRQAAGQGLEDLELMDRGRHIMRALADRLPGDFPTAIGILLDSLDQLPADAAASSMSSFRYLPHTLYVAEFGLDHLDLAMQAQYELTQRFTAEFSIRPFLDREPERTLAVLHRWCEDPNPHVRRLVSEGTRPRLPWAPRLRAFQRDPSPAIALLERLKDDPEPYVQRSVANHLNDIGKDHPDLLISICRRWAIAAPPARLWIIRHALRSAVKQGQLEALAILGFGEPPQIAVEAASVTPAIVMIGAETRFAARIRSLATVSQELLVDYAVHYVKANGKPRPKVFKLGTVTLAPGASVAVGARIRFADLTTRKHYPGEHAIDLRINGQVYPVGVCTVRAD